MTGPDLLFDVLAGVGARSTCLVGWRAYKTRTTGIDQWADQSAAVKLDAIAAASRISRAAYDAQRAVYEEIQPRLIESPRRGVTRC